ncbi:GNAT family N-acetyltransferase [Shinella daejeonensis]|uniref:GNAT family N-acetyltransferase n=1 Tax=Shinella daejeonensis TaxID=659017 RepID=UPI0020C77053|nr:GNAT family protein [Shinella daejeonensis]MCP8896028.1 GNAT family N-acetyltransferase [Shinella daejeonensis]
MQRDITREDRPRSFRQRPGAVRSRTDCPILLSRRLVLRPPHEDDIDALAHLANNAGIANMVARMPHPYTAADAADFVRRSNAGEMGKCVYAITKADNGAFLGCCGIETQEDARTVELGYWLGEPFWNEGYATEAAHVLIDMVFRTRDVDQIDACCRVTNLPSRRVIQKCGFQFQATGMMQSRAVGSTVPVEWYRLDRKTWVSLKNWGEMR